MHKDEDVTNAAPPDAVYAAERFVLMAAEFAQFTLEVYADIPSIAALLDAITDYQAAQES